MAVCGRLRCVALALVIAMGAAQLGLYCPFRTLAVSRDASFSEVKKAYHRLSLKYHPDKSGGGPSTDAMFMKITKAYKELSDKPTRELYRKYGPLYSIAKMDMPGWLMRGFASLSAWSQTHPKESAITIAIVFLGSLGLQFYRLARAVNWGRSTRLFLGLVLAVLQFCTVLIKMKIIPADIFEGFIGKKTPARKAPNRFTFDDHYEYMSKAFRYQKSARYQAFTAEHKESMREPEESTRTHFHRSAQQPAWRQRTAARADDGGPWPCDEAGCPGPLVNCSDLREWCEYRFSDAWDEHPPQAVKQDFVWRHCPVTCGIVPSR